MTDAQANTRVDVPMPAALKVVLEKAAAIQGLSVAGYARLVLKQEAEKVIERENRLRLAAEDSRCFVEALEGGFQPNEALERAMSSARQDVNPNVAEISLTRGGKPR